MFYYRCRYDIICCIYILYSLDRVGDEYRRRGIRSPPTTHPPYCFQSSQHYPVQVHNIHIYIIRTFSLAICPSSAFSRLFAHSICLAHDRLLPASLDKPSTAVILTSGSMLSKSGWTISTAWLSRRHSAYASLFACPAKFCTNVSWLLA